MANETPEQLHEVLDLIHEIAAKAGAIEGTPREVDEALDKIVSLARYKFNVVNEKTGKP